MSKQLFEYPIAICNSKSSLSNYMPDFVSIYHEPDLSEPNLIKLIEEKERELKVVAEVLCERDRMRKLGIGDTPVDASLRTMLIRAAASGLLAIESIDKPKDESDEN